MFNRQICTLNLGCGNDTYGTHRVDMVPTKATTHVFNIEKGILFPDEYFDEVYEKNLFEHLKNHGFHLSEVYRVLRNGGKCILITDNAQCVKHYLFRTHTGGYCKAGGLDRHYAIFTKEHLKNLFLSQSFHIEKIEYIETDYWTRWLDKILKHIIPQYALPAIKVVARK